MNNEPKQLFFHPESNSYVEVPQSELQQFASTPDGARCVPTKDVVVFVPPARDFAVVATEAVLDAVAKAEQALIDAPAIVDQSTQKQVQEVVRGAKKTYNMIDAARATAKAPFLEACRRIDAAAQPLLQQLNEVMSEGKRQQAEFLTERDRRLALEEAQRRANETQAAKDTSRPTAPLVPLALADPIQAPLTTHRRVVIRNEAELPREYLTPNIAKIEAAALAGIAIPGVEVVVERSVVAR